MVMSEGKLAIDVRARTRVWNLRVRLRGALWSTPAGTAHSVSASVRARFRSLLLRVSLTLFQVLGVPSATNPPCQPQSSRSTEIHYSLRIRLRKLWLRIRGKQYHESSGTHTPQVSHHSPIPPKKPKWRRTFSSVSNQLLQRTKSSKITTSTSEVRGCSIHL